VAEHVWLDGRLVPARDARVPAVDRAVQYGFGLFEVLRAYRGAPFRLEDHLDRMARSARRFGLSGVPAAAVLRPAIRSLCSWNGLDDACVRVVLTAGDGTRRGSVIVLARRLDPVPPEWYERGARARVALWTRDPRAPLHGHKTLNYLENNLVRNESRAAGWAETLFLDPDGRVLEGSVTNVFLVSRGRLVTPGLEGVLPGVTRKVVLEIASRLRLPRAQRAVRVADLHRADEVFLTNALIEILPLTRLGTRRLKGPGPVTRRIAGEYRALAGR
jgi:branched-subunit amino acid aminotransferase/4-amino-4-deoxychorismate lyase